MKNEILDDIFHDKLRAELEDGEVVFWEGSPQFNYRSGFVSMFFVVFVFGGFYFFDSILNGKIGLSIFWAFIFFFGIFQIIYQQKKTRYLITNLRIIFQIPKGRKQKIHSLPLNHLEEVSFTKEGGKHGVIFLTLKKPFKTDLKTINIKSNSMRKTPTLELIENAEEVVDILQKGIKGEL